MATEVEIDRVLAVVRETLNDQKLTQFDPDRVQEIVTGSLGGEPKLTVDAGGGLHDESGARVGAIRKAPSGEWMVERQNTAAPNAHVAVPAPEGKQR